MVLLPALLYVFILISSQQAYAQAPQGHVPRPVPPRQVLPLDPLTPEEERVAEQVARADPRVQKLLGSGRQRLIEVEFLALKPEHDEALTEEDEGRPIRIGRHAGVVFIRYEGNLGVYAIVDLQGRLVTQVESRDGDIVPASFEELAEARELALQSEALSEELVECDVEGMRQLAVEESDPCWQHRCLRLLFRCDGLYRVDLPAVIVDLTTQTVQVEGGAQ